MNDQLTTQRQFRLGIAVAPEPKFSDCHAQTLTIQLISGPALEPLDVELFGSGIMAKLAELPSSVIDPMPTFMGYSLQSFEIVYIGPQGDREMVQNAIIALFLETFNAAVRV